MATDPKKLDALVARWCRKSDVEALSDLFDLAAPSLLKIAMHLGAGPAEAEDLVQSTFLALIERREELDSRRSGMAWLTGVLHHKAIDVRRRKGRQKREHGLDLNSLMAEGEDAARSLERRELDAVVVESIDRVDEPYRQVLLMRIRHGASMAEIAHLLERSPSTVRVQLHRGLEKLRGQLPPSLATAAIGTALLSATHTRGLAAVKSVVLQGAGQVATPIGIGTLFGVHLMSQKSLVILLGAVATAVLSMVLLPLAANEERSVQQVGTTAGTRQLEDQVPNEGKSAALVDVHEEPLSRESTSASAPNLPMSVQGTVVEAETGALLEGAAIDLHAPTESALIETLERNPELFKLRMNGVPQNRTQSAWPAMSTLSSAARFSDSSIKVYGHVPEGEKPLSTTVSDGGGMFQVPS